MWGCGQIILHYALFILHYYRFAAVAELADAPDFVSTTSVKELIIENGKLKVSN